MLRWSGLLLLLAACDEPGPENVDDPVVLKALDQVEEDLGDLSQLGPETDEDVLMQGVRSSVEALRIMSIAHYAAHIVEPDHGALQDLLGLGDGPNGTTWDGQRLRSRHEEHTDTLELAWDVDLAVRSLELDTVMNGTARIFWRVQILGVPLDHDVVVDLHQFRLDEEGCPVDGTLELFGLFENLVTRHGPGARIELEVTWLGCGIRRVLKK